MERLVTVKDMAERYGVSLKTARKYIRGMFHYENPLAAPRWAMDEWEHKRARNPDGAKAIVIKEPERMYVPRKRGLYEQLEHESRRNGAGAR